MDNCQSEQWIEPHVSKESIEEEPEGKEENESENDGSSISTPMESTSKGSGKKTKNAFVPEIKAKKKQVFGRTFDHLSKTLRNLTDVIKDDSSQLFVEVSREDAKRHERRYEMFMAMIQRFIMGPPQHMQQPLFNFNTSNNIDIQGSFSQPAPVYGTNSANVSPIWPSTCTTTSTSNNSTSGDVLNHFLHNDFHGGFHVQKRNVP